MTGVQKFSQIYAPLPNSRRQKGNIKQENTKDPLFCNGLYLTLIWRLLLREFKLIYSSVCNEKTGLIMLQILGAATAQTLVALATRRPGYLRPYCIINTILKNTDGRIH
jgi:hypothetical protein